VSMRILFVPLVLSGALLVAGCGGSSSNEESAADWASGLCNALTDWTSSVRSAGNSLKGNISKDSLKSATDDIKSATDTLGSDLKDLGKPNTKGGEDAKNAIDDLSSELNGDVQEMQSAVNDASGAQGAITAASSVGTALTKMGTQINATASKLDQADPAGELKKAFQNSSDCQSLTSSGS
jgi:phage-related protein